MLAYLKARWGEVTSIVAGAGLSGIVAGYLTGQLSAQQAAAASASALVMYLMPEKQSGAAKTGALLIAAMLTASVISACSPTQVQQAATDANNAVASAQPSIEMACWLVQAADAGFQIYAASPQADPSAVADEKKAVAAANVTCANPPSNAAQAIADVMATYKTVVASTPSSGS